MAADTPQIRSFIADAVRWCRTEAEEPLLRLIRSPHSGVPHDIGAAYATLASRTGALLEAIDRGRLALPSADRDAMLCFAERMRRLQTRSQNLDAAALHDTITEIFDLRRPLQEAPALQPARSADAPFALAVPLEPERVAGVPGWPKHFSASALNAYAECARKWFYRYACAAIEDRGSSASAYGTAFHSALEDFHGDFPRPQRTQEAAMRERVRECVVWGFERNREGFETAVEFELQVRRAQRTAQRYVDWLMAQADAAPFEVIGREVPANLDLDGRPFVGFIDRLDRNVRTGGIGVVDYKTGSIASSADEYREKVRRFRDFQLPFYYWARTAAGDRVAALALIPLKDARLDIRPVVLEVVLGADPARSNGARSGTIAVAELERARARMIELADELSSGRLERFDVSADPAACTYCAYAMACARKPEAPPERFGR